MDGVETVLADILKQVEKQAIGTPPTTAVQPCRSHVIKGYPPLNKSVIIDAKGDQTWLLDASVAWRAFLDNPPYEAPPAGNAFDGTLSDYIASFDSLACLKVPLVNTTPTRRPYVPMLAVKNGAPSLLLVTGFEDSIVGDCTTVFIPPLLGAWPPRLARHPLALRVHI